MPSGIGTRVQVPSTGLNTYSTAFVRSAAGNTPAPRNAGNIPGANPSIQMYEAAPGDNGDPAPGNGTVNPSTNPTTPPNKPPDTNTVLPTDPNAPAPPVVSNPIPPAPGVINNIPGAGNLLAGFDTTTLLLLLGAGVGLYFYAKQG